MNKPTLTKEQYLDAVFSNEYDSKKIEEIKKWQKDNKTMKKVYIKEDKVDADFQIRVVAFFVLVVVFIAFLVEKGILK